MRTAFALILCATTGWALEVAHPVYLPGETIVVWTAPIESPPQVECLDLRWQTIGEGEKVRWEAVIPTSAAPGVYLVATDRAEAAVLVVPRAKGLVEVETDLNFPLALDGQVAVPDPRGRAYFVADPGVSSLAIPFLKDPLRVKVEEGKRVKVPLVSNLDLWVSSSLALPGSRLCLTARFSTWFGDDAYPPELLLPSGWDAEFQLDQECLAPDQRGTWSWTIMVPSDAPLGQYSLALRVGFPWGMLERAVSITVASQLEARTVVGHWDLGANELDLASPFAITYDRLRWAASIVGKVVPHSREVMTPELWQELAEEWQATSGGG